MNADKVKTKIQKLVEKIKSELKCTLCYVYEDLDIPEEPLRLDFGGWSTIEGYERHILEYYFDLEKYINLVYLQEGLNRANTVVSWVIVELSFDTYQTMFTEHKIPNKVTEIQIEEIKNSLLLIFLVKKKEIHEYMLTMLKARVKTNDSQAFTKIKWRGSQTQLAELFGQLIMKNWIDQPSVINDLADALDTIFDLTGSYRTENPNVKNNLRKHLQPAERKGKTYFDVCIKGNAAFSDISSNKLLINT